MKDHEILKGEQMMKKFIMICLVIYLCILYGNSAFAQYARAYANAPRSSHILQFHSITSTSNTADEDALENRKTETNIYSPTYVYTFPGLKNMSGGIGFSLPVIDFFSYDRRAGIVLNDTTGLGDLTILFDHNFFGGKSMDLEEFVKTKAGTYGGIHFALSLPTGDYDTDKSANIGSNRYALKTTYQHSLAFNDAATWLDFYGYVSIYGDNNEYQGRNELSQNSLLGLEAFFSHNLTPTVWIEAGMIYTHGGAIKINGAEQVGKQNILNGVLGFTSPMWKRASVKFLYTPTLYDNRDNFVKGYSVRILFQQVF